MACHFKTVFIIFTVIVEKMQLPLALSTQNGLVHHPDYTMASITVQTCDGFHLSSFQNWISWTKVTKIKVETNMPTCRYDSVNRCQSHPLQNGQFITDLGHSTLLSDKTRSQKWKHHRKNTTKNHQGRKHQHKKPVSTNSTLKTCTINFHIYYYKTCSKIFFVTLHNLSLWPPYLLQLVTAGWSTPVILEESWETLSIGFHSLRTNRRSPAGITRGETKCATENMSLQEEENHLLTASVED